MCDSGGENKYKSICKAINSASGRICNGISGSGIVRIHNDNINCVIVRIRNDNINCFIGRICKDQRGMFSSPHHGRF